LEDKAVATVEELRLEQVNRRLRTTLAQFGAHRDERKPGETLQEENRRLQADLQWYQRLLRDSHYV
jgi:hypothetical protein